MQVQITRVALWGTRLLGVLAALYVGGLCAGNIHGAWNVTDRLGLTYTNWPEMIFLIGGIVLAAIVFYVVLGASTVRATFARLVLGVIALVVWLLVVEVGPAVAVVAGPGFEYLTRPS